MALPAENLKYTYADVLNWDEDVRAEVIAGEVYMMSPPATAHQRVFREISAQLYDFLKDKPCELFQAPFGVRLFEQKGDKPEDVDTLVEPDISVICDKNKIDKHGCKGAPDLIIEILSPSTARHDRFTKYKLYERAGVREYWIVDPEAKVIQSFVLKNGRYDAKDYREATETMAVTVLEGCTIELAQVFSE